MNITLYFIFKKKKKKAVYLTEDFVLQLSKEV